MLFSKLTILALKLTVGIKIKRFRMSKLQTLLTPGL